MQPLWTAPPESTLYLALCPGVGLTAKEHHLVQGILRDTIASPSGLAGGQECSCPKSGHTVKGGTG